MIAYDLQACQSKNSGDRGIARYVFSVAEALERLDPSAVDVYLVNPDLPLPEFLQNFAGQEKITPSDRPTRQPVEILHVTSPLEHVDIHRLISVPARKLVTNLYDLIPLIFSDRYLADPRTSAHYRGRLAVYSASNQILSDSFSAMRDAQRYLPISLARISVVGAGASEKFHPHPTSRTAAFHEASIVLPKLRRDFVLLPTGMDWRKNYLGAVDAYSRLPKKLRSRHQLVVLGKIDQHCHEQILNFAHQVGCGDDVLLTGFVNESTLVSLNQAAKLVVFPSFYEGFGLPVLEALKCGTPVICSNNSSLPEVQTNPLARFEPARTEDITSLMSECLTNQDFLQKISSDVPPQFTWESVAEKTLDVYRDLKAKAQSPRPSQRRKRLAVVTPLPPVQSGIAAYSFRLLEEMSKLCDIECFTDQDLATCATPSGCKVSPLSYLQTLFFNGQFDEVLYVLGNNQIHRPAIDLARRIPGVVHLHDVRLVNCYLTDAWPDIVLEHYPDRFTKTEARDFVAPWAPAVFANDILLLGDIGRFATKILTNSKFAVSLVRREIQLDSVVDIGPLAMRCGASKAQDPEKIRVASFGIVAETKQSKKVLQAFQLLAALRPKIEFLFVGTAPDDFGDDSVLVTGHVSDSSYEGFLETVSLAVQLRDTSNGESSAAVADCLSYGIPTIVTDIGSMSELPDEVVVKVPREISADELCRLILDTLDDDDLRHDIAFAASEFSRQNSYRIAAQRLCEALET